MKHLPKHLRPRWRYLAVGIETWPDASIPRGAFQRSLWYAAQNLLGDPGSADADLTVVTYEFGDGAGEAIVRARRGEVDAARAALACVADVDGEAIGLRVRGVSGTIRACEERYLGRAAGVRDERDVAFESESRRAYSRDGAVDVETPDGFVGATDEDVSR
ncbi:Rpp14/Pop5 family protein [Halorarum halobium]|uniref:Rpp14/Pop5 family protein n=1 Tax=Halorarum halobium TaxID=3075121 RepID=UPI0028A7B190|nr:Rpp14/Pop5 family protein [Halobaculum sp. XH14]